MSPVDNRVAFVELNLLESTALHQLDDFGIRHVLKELLVGVGVVGWCGEMVSSRWLFGSPVL